MNKDTILVTGGAGYIGSHTIIELLSNTSFNIISADNFVNSSPDSFNRIEDITGVNVTNYKADLSIKKEAEKIFDENPDLKGIIHFAAFKAVGESVEYPLRYYKNNINSLLNLLELQEKYNVQNMIFSSSCSVYGNAKELPVTEDTPFGKAESPYAYTKQIGERIIQDFNVSNNQMRAVLLRYFNPVGAHPSGMIGELPINKPQNLVPVITKTAVGEIGQLTVHGNDYDTRDGTCIRDYIHVSDIAMAHVDAMNYLLDGKNKDQTEIFNLGTGEGITVLEMIQAFEKVSGVKLNYNLGPRRPGDVEAIYANNKKAIDELGWKIRYDLDDMMETAWKWQGALVTGGLA